MTDLQLELTKLIGSKELSFGCLMETSSGVGEFIDFHFPWWGKNCFSCHINGSVYSIHTLVDETIPPENIIGHPATLSDLEKWMESKWFEWEYGNKYTNQYGEAQIIIWWGNGIYLGNRFSYDPSKYLLDQSEETLKEIIDFIKANK